MFSRICVILSSNSRYLLQNRTCRLGGFLPVAMASTGAFTEDVFCLPSTVSSSNTIHKDAFRKSAVVPALRINKRRIHKVLKAFKAATFERVQFQAIRDVPDSPEEKFLLFDPKKLSSLDDVTERQRDIMNESEVENKLHEYTLNLTYQDWHANEVLRGLLPASVEVPTGFSRIGHIIHLNLRQAQLDHKNLIGEVFLEKTPGIQTVVNKLNEIDNTYRFFSMECIAGESNTVVTVKEHHVSYSFDFAKVYWNPRLSTEHQRIIEKLGRTDVVYDMFAGVGPFAIPAAKKGCQVFANDLNPESYRWLDHNAGKNKVANRVKSSNLDGRQFSREIVRADLILKAKKSFQSKAHVIMNLPAMAVEFLDSFPGLLADVPTDLLPKVPEVFVHCHGFSKSEDPAGDIRSRVESILGQRLESPEIHDVRDVAPNKEMMCISFRMPSSVLFTSQQGNGIDQPGSVSEDQSESGPTDEPTSKKPRVS